MKKIIISLFLTLIVLKTFSQETNIQFKLDSIIKEADLLYSYEKTVWNSTDLLMVDKDLKSNYGGYIVQHSNDSLIVSYIDINQTNCIARFYYAFSNLENPIKITKGLTSLTEPEQKLLNLKIKIVTQLSDSKYNVVIPQGFSPNIELIKKQNEYDLYIIMGTSDSGIIPFGNDYLFRTDSTGTIIMWRKFHSRMIPAQSKGPNGEKVISAVHSHLKTTPYITATDICTFRLYGEICGMEEFTVLCTATGKYYKYNLRTNKIIITGF
jgi:hypothetical protein